MSCSQQCILKFSLKLRAEMHSLLNHPPSIATQIEGTITKKKNRKKKLKIEKMNYNLI